MCAGAHKSISVNYDVMSVFDGISETLLKINNNGIVCVEEMLTKI